MLINIRNNEPSSRNRLGTSLIQLRKYYGKLLPNMLQQNLNPDQEQNNAPKNLHLLAEFDSGPLAKQNTEHGKEKGCKTNDKCGKV